jgi:hypothetical protein
MNGFTGVVSGSGTMAVINPTGNSGSGSVQGLLSLQIIPSSVTVLNLQGTGQFLAIGTFATAPTVRDLTNSVNWISSAPDIFPISTNGTGAAASGTTAGIITAYGSGNADVIAEAVDPKTGSIQTAQATFNCPYKAPTVTNGVMTDVGTCNENTLAPALLSTLTIYSTGLNSTGWLVTAPSSTGTPNVIHCGPASQTVGLGAPVCTATYAMNPTLPLTPTAACPDVNLPCTPIVVTAPAEPGVKFGGWSANCLPSDSAGNVFTSPPYVNSSGPSFWSETGPNYCVVNLTVNDTVGAVFN